MTRPHTGTNGGQATARKHALMIEGQLWTKRAIARHLGISDSTVRLCMARVWQRGDRLTIRALAEAKR